MQDPRSAYPLRFRGFARHQSDDGFNATPWAGYDPAMNDGWCTTLQRHPGFTYPCHNAGWKWAVCLLQLIVFAVLLMPGFLQVCCSVCMSSQCPRSVGGSRRSCQMYTRSWQVIISYFTSSRVRRGVPYGSKPRNRLDIYVPDNAARARPVVIYVTGGQAPFL